MNTLRKGLTVTCPQSAGVYLLLEHLGSRGWRCLVLVPDPNYDDMESAGGVVVIATNWLTDFAIEVES